MTFSQAIIRWYNKNKRDLPWRHTKDPYKIWLSEIILQQTRVKQGLPYYETFVKKFPTIHTLARAEEGLVMKTWQGLGYYSRARNLHYTAKFISKNLKGKFPETYEEIKKLKGIGEYTAGAIASFAFSKPYPVVDGNVFRVLSRYFGIKTPVDSTKGKQEFYRKALSLLDKQNPGLFNQAIMEFGALQCTPQNPDCEKCPLSNSCKAFANNEVPMLPIKSKKVNTRNRYFNYFIIRKKGKILIRKRMEKDIWENLYDFPMIESKKKISCKHLLKMLPKNNTVSIKIETETFKHILSHQIIFAKFWEIKGSTHILKFIPDYKKGISMYINDNQRSEFAFPRLIAKYFERTVEK